MKSKTLLFYFVTIFLSLPARSEEFAQSQTSSTSRQIQNQINCGSAYSPVGTYINSEARRGKYLFCAHPGVIQWFAVSYGALPACETVVQTTKIHHEAASTLSGKHFCVVRLIEDQNLIEDSEPINSDKRCEAVWGKGIQFIKLKDGTFACAAKDQLTS